MSDPVFTVVLRAVGASHLLLALAHAVLWRAFGWRAEIARLSPLTGRVFVAHLSVVAFVLTALGMLVLVRPELLAERSELGQLLLGAVVVFWLARLIAQPLVFDPALLLGSRWRPYVRLAATALFGSYVAVYAWALARQAL